MSNQQVDGPPTDEEYIDEVIENIRAELIKKRDKYRRAVEQAGGWEGKFQVNVQDMFEKEIKTAGNNDDPLLFDHEVTREEMIFADSNLPGNKRKKADVLFNPHVELNQNLHPDTPAIGVELKVSSAGQNGTNSSLAARFKKDIVKCAVGVDFTQNARISNAPAVLWLCVGVTHDIADMATLGIEVPTKMKGGERIENEDSQDPQIRTSTNPEEGPGFSQTKGQFIAIQGKNIDRRSFWLVWAWKAEERDADGESDDDAAMDGPADDEDGADEDEDMDVDDDSNDTPPGKKPSSKGASSKGKGKQVDKSTASGVAGTSKAKKNKASSAVPTGELARLDLDDDDMDGTVASASKKQSAVQKKKTDKKKNEAVSQSKDARAKPVKKATKSSSGATAKVKTKTKSSTTG